MLTNMLQLLLTVAQSGEDPDTVAAACTAVKALLHAAAAAGWDGLPSVVGLPIQVRTAPAVTVWALLMVHYMCGVQAFPIIHSL
jgi:hypothetical protein